MCGHLHIQNTSILGHMAWLWGDQSYLVFGVIIARAILVVWCYSAPSNTLSHTFQPFLFICFLSFFFFFLHFRGPVFWLKDFSFILQFLPKCPPTKFSYWQLASPGKLFSHLFLRWADFPGPNLTSGGLASLHDKGPAWVAKWSLGLVPKQPGPPRSSLTWLLVPSHLVDASGRHLAG